MYINNFAVRLKSHQWTPMFSQTMSKFKLSVFVVIYICTLIHKCASHSEAISCREDQFLCQDREKCIPKSWRCDYSIDCADGSDEPSDCPAKACSEGQFQCSGTQQCIPMGWVCDGEPDCGSNDKNVPDHSDEDAKRCHKGNSCSPNYFRCKDGLTCKKIVELCDGRTDCPDGSDELDFCHNKQQCSSANCSYGCKPSPKGPSCYCEEGKEPNGTECIDINECDLDGVCEQLCTATGTSHRCSCVQGYEIDPVDHTRCNAFNVPANASIILLFSNSINVQKLHLNGTFIQSNSASPKEILALDFDHRNRTTCWIAHNGTETQMECATIEDLSHAWTLNQSTLYSLESVNQMAFDWVSKNWYFLDDTREMIFMCNESLSVCLTVVDVDLSKPRGIALDPTVGYMFFTEWGSTAPLLERARCDGSNRTRLVEQKIVYPYGVAVDYPNQHVYWVDTYLDFIERVNYDGSKRHTVIRGVLVRNLYGITLFERYLYVTSWHGNSVIRVNKYNQSDIITLKRNLTRPFSIHVYHRQRQPGVEHPCASNNGGCEHLCITSYRNRIPVADCRCAAGYRLVRGRHCVVAKQSTFILYARGRPGGIKGISISGSGKGEVIVPITKLNRPTALDYDARSQFIYYSDVQRFVIEKQKIDGTQREAVVDKGLNNCEGIAIDWMAKNLYWSDEGLLSISVARLSNTSIRRRLVQGNMSHPRAIVLDPKRGFMYWSDWSTEPGTPRPSRKGGKIERAHMDGGERSVFVSKNLQWPNGLSLDLVGKKLYWCDAYLHVIERISLDGTSREMLFSGERIGHPYGLSHHENYLYWTEFQQGVLQRVNLQSKKVTEIIRENPPLFEIKLFDNSSQTGSNGCTENNGGCSDLCLSAPKVGCACRDGYTLASDKITCEVTSNYTEPSRCKEGEFQCVKNFRCIDVRYVCDGDNDCGDGSDEDSSPGAVCEHVTCKSDNFRCDEHRCISIHWVCDGERDCADETDEEPKRECRNVTCSSSQFTCKTTGRCIPLTWTCDADPDCGDGDTSDEHEKCEYPQCEPLEFRCANKRCVPLHYVCDGDDDCRDSSDEKNCSKPCTDSRHFSCDNGEKCLDVVYRCDGTVNCKDGSDEKGCLPASKISPADRILCHSDEFKCLSGECILTGFVCDGHTDCIDSSDERDCANRSVSTCDENHFRCVSDGVCIPAVFACDGKYDCSDSSDEVNCTTRIHTPCWYPNKVCLSKEDNSTEICMEASRYCDGKIDCADGSDEGGLCEENHCILKSCQAFCRNTPQGSVCDCPKGLRLALDRESCTDNQPCDEWGACSQMCKQLKSSHKCGCMDGYQLEPDGYTCKSTDKAVPYIIFSNRYEIRSVNLRTMAVKPLISGLKNTIALDFFHSTDGDLIFWTDVVDDKIYRGSVIYGSLTNIEVVVQTGLATAEGLAVDWIGENIYWVESNLDQIEVAKLNGTFRRTLVAGEMESPRAIALDPRYGVMFWTDWDSESPRIETASMSGDERHVVFRVDETEGAWPNGLTLDYVALRIYWIDARSDSIHSITYEGTDHHEILRGHELLTHPFAIALFENYVYWTDWRTNSVIRANKWNGTDIKIIQRAITQPFDIQIYHSSRQPKSNFTHPCQINNGGCSHLCLLTKNSSSRCECPHVMKLAEDGKICVVNEKVLLISRSNEIRGVDLEKPYHHIIPPISLPKVIYAGQVDFEAQDRRIYWADSQLNEVKRANLTGNAIETIIDTVVEHPFGFTLDWVSRNLFITSQEGSNGAKIYACNVNGEYIYDVIKKGLHHPRSLAVDPFDGLLFWADYGILTESEAHEGDTSKQYHDSYIAMSAMDGTNIRVLTNTSSNPNLVRPSNLAFDVYSKPYRLYWVNIGSSTIQWVDLKSFEVRTLGDESEMTSLQPFAISVYYDKLFVSSQTNNSIYLTSKSQGTPLRIFRNQTEGVLSLRVYDKDAQSGSNPCRFNNGNCSHLCLPVSKTKRVCKCAIGYDVDPQNETNCIGAEVFLLYYCNWGLKGISHEPNSTRTGFLPPISRVLMATRIDFSYENNWVYWVDSDDGSINRIRRDTTGHGTVIRGLESVEGVAVDWIANNIYWVDPSYDVIEVSRLNGQSRFIVVSGNMDKPNGIVLDPIRSYIFWSDIGSPVKIERADLDGSNRVVVLNDSSGITITNLAVDLLEEKLYWCDSRSVLIERINFSGGDREVVLKSSEYLKSPASISLMNEFLYVADVQYKGGAIFRADKNMILSNFSSVQLLRERVGDDIKDIEIYYKRPTSLSNPCAKNNGDCQELCLSRSDGSRRCACAHGKLAKNNKTCAPYDAFLMYSKVLEIDSIHLSDERNLNSPYPIISNKETMRNVIGLTFDYQRRRIIYSDIQKGCINTVFFNGSDHKVLVEKQGSVEGIAFDQLNQDLYWTSNSDASISRLNLVSKNATIEKIIRLFPDDKPRGIAVDSCASRIYWTNWNVARPSIQRAYLSGYDMHSIITTEIKMPNAITLDHKMQKLFWSDARLDKIERCNLDGTERVVILKEAPQHPFDLAVYGSYIFWTDWVAHTVYRANKFTGSDVVALRKNVARPMGIIAVADDAEDCTVNPCLRLNGGCSDICSVNVNGTIVCTCHPGRVLADDGERCLNFGRNSNCSVNEFECQNGRCIPYELTCDHVDACTDRSDEDEIFCASRKCPENFFSCTNNRCIPHAKVCDGENNCADSSDEVNCTCTTNSFKCKNGPCIGHNFRCDNDPDCPDASDEIGCLQPNCSHHPLFYDAEQKFVNCRHTTACIHPDWVCDGQNDCWDWSDEKDCPTNTRVASCPPTSFQCKSGHCIPLIWHCDRDNDCEDNKNSTLSSDEEGCNYGCQADQFKCNNSDCIPSIWRCDGHKDCVDGSDESDDCQSRKCLEGWFRCNSTGQCIPQVWVCDGENDCEDSIASDEHPSQGCHVNMCKPSEFQCNNFQCILKSFYCDGDNDCGDESDEPANCTHVKCHDGQFECANKKCIPEAWKCNGIDDCLDNSDELDVNCTNATVISNCTLGQFECENHNCLDPHLLCDGENNCGDYSDESRCNVNECESGFACAQKCEDMPIGYKCSCFPGFESSDGGRLCKDIDECRTRRPCSQFCRNTYGSYACSCAKGYYSVESGTSCVVSGDVKPSLLFSNRYFIRQLDVKGHDSHLKVSNLTNAVALDYDWETKCVFWSDITASGSSIKSLCEEVHGQDVKMVEHVIHDAGVKSPDGLAVDWFGRNLYWCDKLKDTIEVSRLDGQFRKVLVCDGLREPRAIVLNPFEGYMYWTDWGENPYIGRAAMDGSNFTILINESLGWPNALTIDYVTKELFWADAREDYIAVSDLDGHNRWIVASRKTSGLLNHIFAMTVFEDYIYWSDWETASIAKCHKYNCHNATRLANVSHRPMDIKIYHPARQAPLPQSNPCVDANCNTLCLLRPGGSRVEAVCACPSDFASNSSNTLCKTNCLPSCDSWCLNGGTCQRTGKRRQCLCPEGYSGPRCQRDICGCQNDGVCEIMKADQKYKCRCQDGFTGSRCEVFNVSSCNDTLCKNGGNCELTNGRASCKCSVGFSGYFCEKTKPRSLCEAYCLRGSCNLPEGPHLAPICNCPDGWTGKQCNTSLKCSEYCLNGAQCDVNNAKPRCLCPPGYSGPRCETIPITSPDFSTEADLDDHSTWVFVAVLPIVVVLLLAFGIFVGMFVLKFRQRSRAFMHRRMEENRGNVEIGNPVFGGDDLDEESSPSDALSGTFSIEVDEKSTNFTNPVYEYMEEEKRTLLLQKMSKDNAAETEQI